MTAPIPPIGSEFSRLAGIAPDEPPGSEEEQAISASAES